VKDGDNDNVIEFKSAAATSGFKLTERQAELNKLLAGPATHVMAWGGSRSGKTFTLVRAICIRAMRVPGSRHLVARFRFAHVLQSIWHDTLPKVMSTCFPDVKYKADKASWFIEFPNGSQIWFGGLDDKERTEKVLGNEYATILLNEVSQIALAARNLIITRLAQNCGLPLKCYLDCNPPVRSHWCHRLFIEKREALPPYANLKNADAYVALQMNPIDNQANLPAAYLAELQALPARERARFFEGRFGEIGENALWSFELIETYRKSARPDIRRTVVAVDPSGTKGDGGDEIGIVVVGLGLDGEAYVLEDASVKAPPSVWARVVINCADRHDADCIVAETNYGGALVEQVIKTASTDPRMRARYKEVTASRGKHVRAEPISALYEQGRVHHVGAFPALEDQLLAFTTAGYMGDGSPDRADALIWGLTELFPRVTAANSDRRDQQQAGTVGTWAPGPGGRQRQVSYLGGGANGTAWDRHKARTDRHSRGGSGTGNKSGPAWGVGRGWK
jgi:predicted phage terminase large subunit-like protein